MDLNSLEFAYPASVAFFLFPHRGNQIASIAALQETFRMRRSPRSTRHLPILCPPSTASILPVNDDLSSRARCCPQARSWRREHETAATSMTFLRVEARTCSSVQIGFTLSHLPQSYGCLLSTEIIGTGPALGMGKSRPPEGSIRRANRRKIRLSFPRLSGAMNWPPHGSSQEQAKAPAGKGRQIRVGKLRCGD